MKVSAAIITRNDAVALDRCLASLGFCDEVVVLDQDSRDQTAAVCARHGARLEQTAWLGFGPTKQRAVEACRNRWVFSIDSDEVVTPALARAVVALPGSSVEAAYTVNRISRFLGHWIRHCGWHPEHIVRLFDRERAGFDDKPVHESVLVEGPVGRIDHLLEHYPYETMEQYIGKLDRYTTTAAAELHADGKRSDLARAVVRSQAAFWRMWLLQGGFRDGWAGTVLCQASAFYVLSKYVKLWRLGRP